MQGKPDKKMSVVSKTNSSKKPNLQIKIPHQPQHDGVKSGPAGFSSFTKEDPNINSKYQSTSTVTTPTKNIQQMSEIPEHDKVQVKKKDSGNPIQKKINAKEVQSPKTELQPRMSAHLLGSPKANVGKDKVLITNGSEKNLNAIKPIERKQTPQGRTSKIQELQRLLNDEKARSSMMAKKEQLLHKDYQDLKKQNNCLKEENTDLKKKIEKYKLSNEQTRKMLRERIHNFNEEGGELQLLRKQIQNLEEKMEGLFSQNQALKSQLNKYEVENLTQIREQTGQIATSVVKEVVPLSGSRISGLYLKDSDQEGLKMFDNMEMENMEPDLDLQGYISEKQQSYLEQHRANTDVFDKIRFQYKQILASIELRYKNLCEDYEQTISSQAGELYKLELKNDEISQNGQESIIGVDKSIYQDECYLKAQEEIATLHLAVFDLKDKNKALIEQAEQQRAQRKFIQTELDVQIMKKKFKDENDKFEFNVVKLNLLNIIDKLKLQIDKEKSKFKKFKERVSSDS